MAANDIMEGSIMLVLSRKVGESILISESIRVTVVQVHQQRPHPLGDRGSSGGHRAPRGTDQVLLQLVAKQERQSGSTASFRLAAPSIQVQPDLPVRKPPGPLSGTGNGVIQMTIAPSSQGGSGAGWEVGELTRSPSCSSPLSHRRGQNRSYEGKELYLFL